MARHKARLPLPGEGDLTGMTNYGRGPGEHVDLTSKGKPKRTRRVKTPAPARNLELPPPTLSAVAREHKTKMERIQYIVELYFREWGAAKAAEWEFLTGDMPFTCEIALEQIRKTLDV